MEVQEQMPGRNRKYRTVDGKSFVHLKTVGSECWWMTLYKEREHIKSLWKGFPSAFLISYLSP